MKRTLIALYDRLSEAEYNAYGQLSINSLSVLTHQYKFPYIGAVPAVLMLIAMRLLRILACWFIWQIIKDEYPPHSPEGVIVLAEYKERCINARNPARGAASS